MLDAMGERRNFSSLLFALRRSGQWSVVSGQMGDFTEKKTGFQISNFRWQLSRNGELIADS
jgi:hypothetical protein